MVGPVDEMVLEPYRVLAPSFEFFDTVFCSASGAAGAVIKVNDGLSVRRRWVFLENIDVEMHQLFLSGFLSDSVVSIRSNSLSKIGQSNPSRHPKLMRHLEQTALTAAPPQGPSDKVV